MDCENTESFTASEIIIGSQIVYDDDDVTQIFRISQDYTAPVQFACAISDRSLRIAFSTNSNPNATNATDSTNSTVSDTTESSENTDTTSRNSNNARFSRANSSKGLSGGAIAGIVVSCVVVVAIVGVLIALVQKGTFAGAGAGAAAASSVNDVIDNSSTVNQFNINNLNRI
jgi:hypothetical protein